MLIITSPHQAIYADYFRVSPGPGAAGDMPQFGAPQTKLQVQFMNPALWEGAAECGLRSFQIMASALDGLAVESKLLNHEDVTGVGYGVATFAVTGPDKKRRFAAQ